MHLPLAWMLIGVSGSGKTCIGNEVAARLAWPFLDADDLHAKASIERMARGVALDDAARWPWLAQIGEWIDQQTAADQSSVIACSALKRSYRDALRAGRPRLRMILLQVDRMELARRLETRRNHFMGPDMLRSQLTALEPPTGENVMTVKASGSIDQVAINILREMTRSA